MAVPSITAATSVLAPFVGETWTFQPSASALPTSWREVAATYVFTANSSTDIITITGALPANGDRFILASGGTLPAPLVAGAYYYARDCDGATCKLALTLGGAAIDLADTGSGTHTVAPTNLPPGLILSTTNGRISGVPLTPGVFEVTLIAHNGDGDSAALVFPIGVRRARTLLDAALPLQLDWHSGAVTTPTALGLPPIKVDDTTSVTPLIALKNADQRMISLLTTASGQAFSPAITSVVMTIRREDQEQPMAATSGSFSTQGSGPDTRRVFELDLTSIPTGGIDPLAVLNDNDADGPDLVLCYADLRLTYDYEVSPGTVESLKLSSQSFPVALARALFAA